MCAIEQEVDFGGIGFMLDEVFAVIRDPEFEVEGTPAWCVGATGTRGDCGGCESEGEEGEGKGGEMHDVWGSGWRVVVVGKDRMVEKVVMERGENEWAGW